jgi:hypothetical protein
LSNTSQKWHVSISIKIFRWTFLGWHNTKTYQRAMDRVWAKSKTRCVIPSRLDMHHHMSISYYPKCMNHDRAGTEQSKSHLYSKGGSWVCPRLAISSRPRHQMG